MKVKILIHMKMSLKTMTVLPILQPLSPGPTFTQWISRWPFYTVQMILPGNIFCPNFPFANMHSPLWCQIPTLPRLNFISGLSDKLGKVGKMQVGHQKTRPTATRTSRCVVSLPLLCPSLGLEMASLLPNLRS